MVRLGILFAVVLIVFDIICAVIARLASIAYADFIILGLVLYLGMGIMAGRKLRRWPRALVAIVIAAVADAAIGWYASWTIGPGSLPASASVADIVAGAVFAVAAGVFFGAIGIALGLRALRSL